MAMSQLSRAGSWLIGTFLVCVGVADAVQGQPPPPRPQFGAPVPLSEEPVASHTVELFPEDKTGLDARKDAPPNLANAAPVLPLPALVFPIDIGAALRLAELDNPAIGIGREAIQEALGEQLRANAMLLPSLRAGSNYHLHNGVLQTSFGLMRQVDSRSLYAGGGSRALAAETVAFPAVQLFSPLTDAFFEPLVARRFVAVRRAQSGAITNQTLLDVADRFLELVSAEAQLAAVRESEEDMNQIVQLTAAFARAGQGRGADATRARGEALLLHTQEQRLEERVLVASARLAELLSLDTAILLRSPGAGTGILKLIDLRWELDALIREAQATRPELSAALAEIDRRDAQVREERARPFLPTLSVGYSAGTFGGGTNRTDLVPANAAFGNFGSRADFDVVAYWTVQNLGAGNVARVSERRAERNIASVEQVRLANLVRREVVAAYGRADAGQRRLEIAAQQLQTAETGFQEDLRRIRGGQGLPIEILNSVDRLNGARLNFIEAILEYNQAQFQLFVAVGRKPTIVATRP